MTTPTSVRVLTWDFSPKNIYFRPLGLVKCHVKAARDLAFFCQRDCQLLLGVHIERLLKAGTVKIASGPPSRRGQ